LCTILERERKDGLGTGLEVFGGMGAALGKFDRAETALLEVTVAGPLLGIVENFFGCCALVDFGLNASGF